jgi:hypothetical protein
MYLEGKQVEGAVKHRGPSFLKAHTVYQFPHLYLNPGESRAVTFPAKGLRDIIQCQEDYFPNFAGE